MQHTPREMSGKYRQKYSDKEMLEVTAQIK